MARLCFTAFVRRWLRRNGFLVESGVIRRGEEKIRIKHVPVEVKREMYKDFCNLREYKELSIPKFTYFRAQFSGRFQEVGING